MTDKEGTMAEKTEGVEVMAQMQKVCDLPDGRPLYFASAAEFGPENSGYKVWDEGAGQHLEIRFFKSPAEADAAFDVPERLLSEAATGAALEALGAAHRSADPQEPLTVTEMVEIVQRTLAAFLTQPSSSEAPDAA